jgi:hypothetical protein
MLKFWKLRIFLNKVFKRRIGNNDGSGRKKGESEG